jgi:hypothetical protein
MANVTNGVSGVRPSSNVDPKLHYRQEIATSSESSRDPRDDMIVHYSVKCYPIRSTSSQLGLRFSKKASRPSSASSVM